MSNISGNVSHMNPGWTRQEIAKNIANDIPDGSYVNLGIGMPEAVASHIPEGREVIFHTENGLLGMGPPPAPGEEDPELINAGKRHVTAITGASFFHHADSFAMIRGGHVDLTVLGAFEVDVEGNIASYMIPGKLIKGMGGAMDLVAGADNIIVTMTHASKHGQSKLLKQCTLPLTGKGCIKKVLTDLAFIEIKDGKFHLLERAPGVSVEEIQKLTEGELVINGDVPEMTFA